MSTKIWYSTNDEEYRHTEIEDAIEDILDGEDDLKVGFEFTIYQGEGIYHPASHYVPDVIEYMGERAYDDCGEYAEEWPDTNPESNKELQDSIKQLVDEWAEKHGANPSFGTIENTKAIRFVVTEMAEYASDIKYKQLD